MQDTRTLSRRGLVLLLLFALLAWFGNLDYRKLAKPDEGRYAEISREMVVSGDWLTPHLNGIKYFEKPPMQYWLTAAAFKAFGISEWTARLWTALAGFLCVVMTWWAGTRLLGEAVGLHAALLLGSCLYFMILGHVNTLDMGLGFFTTLALFAFCYAHRSGATDDQNRAAMAITWAALAGAMLSKGLVALVIPAATLVIYTAFTRDWRIWRRLHLIAGTMIFVLLAAPWFVVVSIANPEFPWFFFVHEHLLRYATPIARRAAPWWSFIALLMIGVLPWVVSLFDGIRAALRRPQPRPAGLDVTLFLLIWSAFVLGFFSISKSKLPSYILPMFPAVALLMGAALAKQEGRSLLWRIVPAALVCVAILVAAGVLGPRYGENAATADMLREYALWLYAAAAILGGGTVFAWVAIRSGRRTAGVVGFAASAMLAVQSMISGYETLSPNQSAWVVVEQIKPYIEPDATFYSVKMYDQTLPFYLGRTVTLVAYLDEFAYGLEQDPTLALENLHDLPHRWDADPAPLAMLRPEHLPLLESLDMPMQVIYRDARRIVVRRP